MTNADSQQSPAVQDRSSSRPAPGLTPRPPEDRDAWLDNAKAILIFLVVVGHATSTITAPGSQYLGAWIYLFHMPAFVFLCGMLSKNYQTIGEGRAGALLRGLVAPYVVFQVVLTLLDYWQNPSIHLSVTTFVTPAWPLWFLPALALWRLATPFLAKLRWPFLWALLVGLVAPMTPALNWTFGVNRAASFLPFFALGLLVSPETLAPLRSRTARLVALAVLVAAFPLAGWLRHRWSFRWLFYSDTYRMLDVSVVHGVAIRTTLFLMAGVLVASILAVSPRRSTVITSWGRYSMYPLLLHAVVVRLFRASDLSAQFTGALGLPLFLVLCVLIMPVMVWKPVRHLCRPVIEPRLRWLLKPDAPQAAAGQLTDAPPTMPPRR